MAILAPRGLVCLVLLTLVLLTRTYEASSSEANSTAAASIEEEEEEDDDDDDIPDITFEEFKERYRRLIPYMTFFVANNFVTTTQTPMSSHGTSSEPEPSASPLIRRPRPPIRINEGTRIRGGGGNYRGNSHNKEKKFIPSVQYDPLNFGSDNDYFTPMRYTSKVNYDDYPGSYHVYHTYPLQKPHSLYPEITTVSSLIAHKDNRQHYSGNIRPQAPRPFSLSNVREYLPGMTGHSNIRDDFLQSYAARPAGKITTGYPTDAYRIHPVHSVLSRYPSILQIPRNPANLDRIVESYQLSERLPDTLNRHNIDNSIKTLVEILNILNSAKKEEFPQVRPPQLPVSAVPLTPPHRGRPPSQPSLSQSYESYEPRPHTRPKVITETRFQATPSPVMLTDDPDRFRATSYTKDSNRDEAHQRQQQHNYHDANSGEKIIEYYTPYVQDISIESNLGEEQFLPTVKPQNVAESSSTQHSYEITEDLSDDVVDEERFALPSTTEKVAHSYDNHRIVPANEVNKANEVYPKGSKGSKRPNVPKNSLKYGVTRGKPNVDYPAYSRIPETDFSCKEQRYKGFFGDPATGCQVWHYCDLNGGKSSFLCPNGTIFSQVALTCDWWFNVKCESTKQLYVLNERLYKYILPIMPKFPEDFTGPEVDRYLEIKFKEMEAKLKEKKLKKQQEGKEKVKAKHQMQNSEG